MGSDAIALPLLNEIAEVFSSDVEIIGVFTQPDRRQGRGMKQISNPIKRWAETRSIPIIQPQKLTEADYLWLEQHGCELLLVMAYGHIIRKRLLELPRLGAFNFHTSLLPAYRGASPIQTAIACGERKTGVTLMGMSRGMDEGPIVDQEPLAIDSTDTAQTIWDKAADACCPLLKRNLPSILTGKVQLTPQDSTRATYCRRLQKEDAYLDFQAPARTLYDRIRAFSPWPGASFQWQGTSLKIGAAQWQETTNGKPPGTLLGLVDNAFGIATGDGTLLLTQLQRPGGRMLGAKEFLSGFDLPSGEILESQPMAPLIVEK